MSRLHGYALAAGGVLMSFSYFAQEALGDRVEGPLFAAALVAHIVGVLAIVFGLPAWQAAQASRTPRLGTIGMIMAFMGFPVLELTGVTIAATTAQLDGVEDAAMASPVLFWVVIVAMIAANLGLVVLAAATLRARVLPRAAAILVITGLLLTYLSPISFPYDEALTLSLAFVGMAWIGVTLAGRTNSLGNHHVSQPALVQ